MARARIIRPGLLNILKENKYQHLIVYSYKHFYHSQGNWWMFGRKQVFCSMARRPLPAPSVTAHCTLTSWVSGRSPTLAIWNHNTLLCMHNTTVNVSSQLHEQYMHKSNAIYIIQCKKSKSRGTVKTTCVLTLCLIILQWQQCELNFSIYNHMYFCVLNCVCHHGYD